jgi:hypothetical protein
MALVVVFVTKEFARFQREAKLSNLELLDAAERVRKGRRDADLGGGVFKQRIARKGEGKPEDIGVFSVSGEARISSSYMALRRTKKRMSRKANCRP